MSKTTRSDLVAPSDRVSDTTRSKLYSSRQKFQFYERRSPASQIRRAYSRNSTRSTQDNVPILTLNESVIEKFESAQRPLSKSVRRITEKKSELETPRSISNFIFFSSSSAELIAMATRIQRNWRISVYKKKLRRFLNFVLKIRRRRLSYAFSMWILTTMPNRDLAQRAYSNVTKFLRLYLFLTKKRKSLYLKSSKMRLVSFSDYMQTNILFSRYPSNIIVKYHQNMNRPLIQRLFLAWFSIASEHLILSKAKNQALLFAQYRENFGPEFWTYHVWKRWTFYKKHRKIELVETISSNIYVPEWTYFRARKLTEARMRREATMHYKIRLGKKIIQLFRDEMHRHNTIKNAYVNTLKYSNQVSQLFGYRAFQYIIIFKRIRQGCLMRALRAWYTVIDSKMLNRTKVSIFRERCKLKLMTNSFKLWRKNIIKESIKIAFLHEQASKHLLRLLPFVFLMRNNFVHYTYATCFINWKKLIDKKKNLKRFVFWSLKTKKKQTLLRFIFDIFKDKAHLPFKKSNYLPFNSNPDQGEFTHISSQKVIMCPSTSLIETINAYQNVQSYQMYQGDWAKYASSSQVQTLFYRLVCLISYKNKLSAKDIQERRIRKIKKFINQKQLYNLHQVNLVHRLDERKDKEMKKSIQAILNRDIHVIAAYDAHSAAIELATQVPQFSINDEIRLFQTSPETFSKEEEEKKENVKEEEEEDVNDDTYSISSNSTQGSLQHFRRRRNKLLRHSTPSIPFLRPINEVKDSLMKMTLKFRRRPHDAFPMRSITSRKTRNAFDMSSHRISAVSSAFGSFYEHFVPLQPDESMIDLLRNKSFTLKELQGLKGQLTDAEIELEPILEVENILDDDLNDYYEYEDVEEEERKEDENGDTEIENKIESDLINDDENKKKKKKKIRKITDEFSKVKIGLDNDDNNNNNNDNNKEDKEQAAYEYEYENDELKPINENTSKVDLIEQSLDNEMTAIDEIEKHFLNDSQYFDFDQSDRISLLSSHYSDVIHLLLGSCPLPQNNQAQFSGEVIQEQTMKTNVTKLLKRISQKIQEDTILNNRKILKVKSKEKDQKKKRSKLFEDPDQQFQEEPQPDGNSYQRSKCPEFAEVLFSGVKVLSNTPWQAEGPSPEKATPPKPLTPTISLPSAENVVPGFEPETLVKKDQPSKGSSIKMSKRTSLFIEKNEEIKEALDEILNDESIDEVIKNQILYLIDKVATKYLREEASKIKNGELTSFVEVDPEATSSDDISEEGPVFQIKKKEKIRQFDERKFAAFNTESREQPPLNSFDGRRRVFYKDLALAILECARFMSRKVIKVTKDIRNETSEYENLKFIKQIQEKQLAEARRKAEIRSKKTISLNINNPDAPVFTKAGVQKWAPPHKIQPTVYYSARNQNQFNSNKIMKNKSLPPTAFSSSVASSVSSKSIYSSASSSTVTISGTVDDSEVQVPLIEITKFDVNLPPPSSSPYRSVSRSVSRPVSQNLKQRPKTQQSQIPKRITFVKASSNMKPSIELKPEVEIKHAKSDLAKTSLSSLDIEQNNLIDENESKNKKKKKKIIKKTITTINEIPIPIPDPDPMQMSQSTRSLKRKPRITKYDPLVPEPQVEFEFKNKTSRSLNSKKAKILDKPLRPKWRPPTDKGVVNKNNLKYFMYVTPYVDQEDVNNQKPNDQKNED